MLRTGSPTALSAAFTVLVVMLAAAAAAAVAFGIEMVALTVSPARARVCVCESHLRVLSSRRKEVFLRRRKEL